MGEGAAAVSVSGPASVAPWSGRVVWAGTALTGAASLWAWGWLGLFAMARPEALAPVAGALLWGLTVLPTSAAFGGIAARIEQRAVPGLPNRADWVRTAVARGAWAYFGPMLTWVPLQALALLTGDGHRQEAHLWTLLAAAAAAPAVALAVWADRRVAARRQARLAGEAPVASRVGAVPGAAWVVLATLPLGAMPAGLFALVAQRDWDEPGVWFAVQLVGAAGASVVAAGARGLVRDRPALGTESLRVGLCVWSVLWAAPYLAALGEGWLPGLPAERAARLAVAVPAAVALCAAVAIWQAAAPSNRPRAHADSVPSAG